MKRIVAGAFLAMLALASTVVLPSAVASAKESSVECIPLAAVPYPPSTNASAIERLTLLSGQFNPGSTGSAKFGGAVANADYCGNGFSTPFFLATQKANAAGELAYQFAVPADFKLNAMHHIDLYRNRSHVGSFDFCVGRTGAIAALSACEKAKAAPGGLARTGVNGLWGVVRVALVLLAVAAAAFYARRRRSFHIA